MPVAVSMHVTAALGPDMPAALVEDVEDLVVGAHGA
jgi:hypothetical protein